MTAPQASLVEVSTAALERIRDAVVDERLQAPLSRASLVSFGVRHQLDALTAALSGHSRLACLGLLDAVLAERQRARRPSPELVWTGPEGHHATARDTAVVLRELFEGARAHVILAGYSFTHAQSVLAPLHASMRDYGVRATFFVDVAQPKATTTPPELHAERALKAFVTDSWPFGAPLPELYCDRRALRPPPPYSTLHAKCVVVDGEKALVSSANFTLQGQERNIEAGVLLHDPHFASHLARQWLALIGAGLVVSSEGGR